MHAPAAVVATSWVAYWVLLSLQYLAAGRMRRRMGEASPRRDDPRSMRGMLAEAIAFAVVFAFRRGAAEPAPAVLVWCGAMLAPAAVLVAVSAARSLGREFRIQAVVTGDQRLATRGPYRFVRHPIYASLLALLLATGIAITRWPALAAAVVVFLLGTEIRVRAEDALLAARFGEQFDAYRARTAAYIPFVR